jgi:hypothetical protein
MFLRASVISDSPADARNHDRQIAFFHMGIRPDGAQESFLRDNFASPAQQQKQ